MIWPISLSIVSPLLWISFGPILLWPDPFLIVGLFHLSLYNWKNYRSIQLMLPYSLKFSIIWKCYKNLYSLIFLERLRNVLIGSIRYITLRITSRDWVMYSKPRCYVFVCIWNQNVVCLDILRSIWIPSNLRNFVIWKK